MDNSRIISLLNPAQQEAVIYNEGPLLILAGAGSGKTRALTHKAAYLIQTGVNPSEILLLTFTNKAAGEMKDRIQKLLITNNLITNTPFAGTFHSFCAKALRTDGTPLGISPRFVIFDEHDQLETMKEVFNRLNISVKNIKPSAVLNLISQAKNELITSTEYLNYARDYFQQTAAKAYPLYQKLLAEQEALDFDDLIFKTVLLFQNHRDILDKYQEQFKYILVDEWQDTNKAQYTLTKLLVGEKGKLTVVGDASQAIYGWRGADYRNINYLANDFPNLKTVNLDQNYRSTQKILNAAYEIIKINRTHPILKLWTENRDGENIKIYQARNETDEAYFIVNMISSHLADGYSYGNFCVLYRTNAQSRVIEEVFLKSGLPYVLVGGVRFYERKEIKDIISYLRVLTNPKDFVSFNRIEKLGKTKAKIFLEFAQNFQKEEKKLNTLEILDKVLEATSYTSMYDPKEEEDLMRLENIKELRSVAMEFPNLYEFLENIALIQESLPRNTKSSNNATRLQVPSAQADGEQVTLMTMHSAKGLEFPVVFIVGMEEGLFPHSRALLDPSEIEEERRLAYVAVTRAKEKLFLTFSIRRFYFGKFSSNMVSRFISDIPESLIEMIE